MPNSRKIFQMIIKYNNILHSKALQILPKLVIWFENKPSGNPGLNKSYERRFLPRRTFVLFRRFRQKIRRIDFKVSKFALGLIALDRYIHNMFIIFKN
jgi:hypothetical protein